MIESFSTQSVDTSNRIDFWNSLHAKTFNGLVIDPRSSEFSGKVRRWNLPNSVMIWPESTACMVQRRNSVCGGVARKGRLALHLLHEGNCRFFQRGRSEQLRRGDMVLFSSEEYYKLEFDRHQMLVLELDRAEFEERVPNLEDVVARAIPRSAASTRLLHQFLISFWREGGANLDQHQAASYEHVMRELLINSLASFDDDRPGTVDGLWERARAIVEARYREQELSPAAIADEMNVSLRNLQYSAAKSGTTLVRYIQNRRLEAAREALMLSPEHSVTRIAFECGFSSSAYFTRCFTDKFGKSPSQVRASS